LVSTYGRIWVSAEVSEQRDYLEWRWQSGRVAADAIGRVPPTTRAEIIADFAMSGLSHLGGHTLVRVAERVPDSQSEHHALDTVEVKTGWQ
jgi:hypothetical protein